MSTVARHVWIRDFLATIGRPVSANNMISLLAWCESERSHTLPPTGAMNNPLDTEEGWPGATDFNSAGVKNYANYWDGIHASAATIKNGYYNGILAALSSSADPVATCARITASPWGSKPSGGLAVAVRNNPDLYDCGINSDGTPPPPPVNPVPFPLPAGDWFGQPSPNPHNHSGYYSASDRVKLEPWQQRMVVLGYHLAIDGYFGPETYGVCIAFQKARGLPVTGMVGPNTWAAAWK